MKIGDIVEVIQIHLEGIVAKEITIPALVTKVSMRGDIFHVQALGEKTFADGADKMALHINDKNRVWR